jgi:hypothetical protein
MVIRERKGTCDIEEETKRERYREKEGENE